MFYKSILESNKDRLYGSFDYTKYLPVENEDGSFSPGRTIYPDANIHVSPKNYIFDEEHILDFADELLYAVHATNSKEIAPGTGRFKFATAKFLYPVPWYTEKSLRLFCCWYVRKVAQGYENARSVQCLEDLEYCVVTGKYGKKFQDAKQDAFQMFKNLHDATVPPPYRNISAEQKLLFDHLVHYAFFDKPSNGLIVLTYLGGISDEIRKEFILKMKDLTWPKNYLELNKEEI